MNEPNNHKKSTVKGRRKLFKFARFADAVNCFEVNDWKLPTQKYQAIELGAGTAQISVQLARQQPDKHYLAIDVKADRLQTGARRAMAENIGNIQFLRAHADQLGTVLLPHSAQDLWLTFPDPFPKDRHIKHRLTHSRFLKMYKTLLALGGRVIFKTDSEALFDWSLEQLSECNWNVKFLTRDLHASDAPDEYKITTTYEERFIKENLPIFLLEATPPSVPAPKHR